MNELEEIISGAEIAADSRAFNTRILYMRDYQHDALVLFEFATHLLDAYTTVPRGLASSPRKQSGKSTWLKSVVMLGWNAWKVDPTSFALRAKFNGRDKPLVMLDEISEYYGKNGLRAGPKDLNKILLEGYENDAQLSLSVDRSPMDVSSFCFAAMGGLRAAVRDDIWDRCIVWKMNPSPVSLEDALCDDIKADGKIHNARIHQWAMAHRDEVKLAFRDFRKPHAKMVARLRQIWGPLYAVALVLGEDWPARCVAAFKAMALDASEMPVLSGEQRVLRDVALLLAKTGRKQVFTRDILSWLRSMPAEDGDDSYYQDLSDRGMALKITAALGPAASMDIGSERAKGYHAVPVLNAWAKLEAKLNPPEDDDEPEDEFEGFFEVTDITDITEVSVNGHTRRKPRKEAA